MAKYRHRIFEMYEQRDEALDALTPRTEKTATEVTAPETWDFAYLQASRVADKILLRFKGTQVFDDTVLGALRDDLTRLTGVLGRDSRLLLDFSDVTLFNAAAIRELAQFSRNLQSKGSRVVLCCLEPAVSAAFFAN
jgi:anti-anti-sigma regulatory factor